VIIFTEGKNDNDLTNYLKFNINRANEIVRLYDQQKIYYLKLNLTLLPAYGVIYGVFLNFFNIWGILAFTIAIIVFFINSLINFRESSKANTTEVTKASLCFFKNYTNEMLKGFSKGSILDDSKTQIENLHKYQENYQRIAIKTREKTLLGINLMIILFLISAIVNCIALFIKIIFPPFPL